MPWPSRADYTQAVRDYPDRSLKDTKLEGGKPRRTKDNFLASYEGGWSIVFPIEKASKTFALRCWLKDVVDAEIRYQKISAHLTQANLPYFVDFEYVSKGIWVRGTKYPITRMEWANGLPLRAFIEQNLQNADVFSTVATEFQKMVVALHAHEISHGDLQDGNILLRRNGAQVDIKLIDYDSVFVPTLRGYPDSGIVGLPEYQHPQRIAGVGQTGEKVDYFSELVIYLSFLSLAEKPELWNQFKDSTGDGLLFSADDFKNPDTSGVFGELEKLSTEIRELSATLKHFCAETSIAQLAALEFVLPKPPHEKCYERGMSYFRRGQDTHAQAVTEFRKAIALKSDFKEAYHSLGLAYLMTGKLDEAKTAAEKALAIDSNYQPAHELLDAIRSRLVTNELRRQNEELQVQIDALRTENQALRTQNTGLGKQLDNTRQELESVRQQWRAGSWDDTPLGRFARESVRQQWRAETVELSKIRRENKKLQTEADKLRSANRALQTEADKLRAQNGELQEEKTASQQQLDRAFRRWKTVIGGLSAICVACFIAIFFQLNSKDKADSRIGLLQDEQQQSQDRMQKLQNQLAEKNTEIRGLKSASQKTVRGEAQLRNQNRTLKNQNAALLDEQEQSQAQLQKLQNQLAEKNTEIRGLKSASQKTVRGEAQLRNQNRTLQNQNAVLLDEQEQSQAQLQKLQNQLAEKNTEIRGLKSASAALLEDLGKAQQNTSGGRTRNMVLIPEGRFQMGSKNGEFDEKPVHTVHVDAFYIDKYEVTNAQYKKFVDANPQWRKHGIPRAYHNGSYLNDWNQNEYPIGKGEHPVTYVSWYAAMAYAQWAGKRLPTEAEWEKAARGGAVGQRYPWGNSIDSGKANYGTYRTTRVGTYPANNYGLYDVVGNVMEWCLDAYREGFYKSFHRRNPLAGVTLTEVVTHFTNQKGYRVFRGGSSGSTAQTVRVANRFRYIPTHASAYVGFRCVKDATR